MTRFEGDRDFSLTADALFARLSDARFLVQCIPDVETVISQEADRASLVLRPGFSFVRGTLEVSLLIVDAVAPSSARVLLHSKGIGSSSDVEAALTLAPHRGRHTGPLDRRGEEPGRPAQDGTRRARPWRRRKGDQRRLGPRDGEVGRPGERRGVSPPWNLASGAA